MTAIFFTGSSEWMNYMYTKWLEYTNFPKINQPFQQDTDIQAVHDCNLGAVLVA
jgi:hypothetical protein